MRRRGVRVFAIIAVIVAFAIATLALKEIHILSFDREASGPLGLTMGLDLQGGSHLVYQADLPDEARVTFQEPVEEARLRDLMDQLGYTDATFAKREFTIRGLSLEEKAREDLRRALALLAPVESFDTGDDALNVTFQDELDEADLRSRLDELDYADAIISSLDEKQFTIQGLSLNERGEEELEEALRTALGEIEALATSGGAVGVTFRNSLNEGDLRSTLNRIRYVGATIESPAQENFTIGELSLDEVEQQEKLRTALAKLAPIEPGAIMLIVEKPSADQMKGVVRTIERRVNALGTSEPIVQTLGNDRVVVQLPGVGGSSIDVGFLGIQAGQVLAVLEEVGVSGFAVGLLEDGYGVIISGDELLLPEVQDRLRGVLAEGIAPVDTFEPFDDTGIIVRFPPPPDESAIDSLLAELGIRDYSIQRAGDSGFIVRTEEVLTTEDQERLRESLEAMAVGVVTFEARGGIEEAKRLIGQTAQLVFKERQCLVTIEELNAAADARLPDPCSPVEEGGGGRFVDTVIDLTGQDLARAYPARNPTTNEPEINLEFNSNGRGIFSDLTKRLAGDQLKRMPIFLDDEQLIAPVVQAVITDGNTRITGRFTREETVRYAIQLESGRLPVPLEPITEISVDALLGADSLRKSLIAGFVGLGLVLLFMVAYYRMAGVVAATALVLYAIIVLAIFKLVPVTITLSGVAGLVLSIGIAVDANILIFERMKEEMRTGRTLTSAMEAGFRRAWPAIRDSNVSTIITCLILWWFGSRTGTPVVTGFALTLLIGVLVSMFSALLVSRNMLQILALTPIANKMNLFTPEPRRQPVGIAGASPEPGRRGGE